MSATERDEKIKLLFKELTDRMYQARQWLTNGHSTPECNWGVLDTTLDGRRLIDLMAQPVDEVKQAEPVAWLWIIGGERLNGSEYEAWEETELSLTKPEGNPYCLTALYAAPPLQPVAQTIRNAALEEAATECSRMMMFPGGRQESFAHHGVEAAAQSILAMRK